MVLWRNTQTSWGWINIVLHWTTAITVIGLFALGLWMVEQTYYDEWYVKAPFIHKSIGLILFFVVLFRLVWRLTNITPESLSTHSQLEKRIAHLAHKIIYILLFAILLSGYLISTANGRGISVFGWFELPATLYGIENQEDIAGLIHLIVSIGLILLVFVHAAGAIKHHFIDKDSTLKRMLKVQ